MTNTTDSPKPKKTGRPHVKEQRGNRMFKALDSEWTQIRKNAKAMNYKSAGEFIRDTTMNIDKWYNLKCFNAILNKSFQKIVFVKNKIEQVVILADSNVYLISHYDKEVERFKLELNSKDKVAEHLEQNGYLPEMITLRQ